MHIFLWFKKTKHICFHDTNNVTNIILYNINFYLSKRHQKYDILIKKFVIEYNWNRKNQLFWYYLCYCFRTSFLSSFCFVFSHTKLLNNNDLCRYTSFLVIAMGQPLASAATTCSSFHYFHSISIFKNVCTFALNWFVTC